MQSEKPTYKKEYEPVNSVDESIWLGNDTPIMESDFTFVFKDRYPCTKGHTLFVPKENNSHLISNPVGCINQLDVENIIKLIKYKIKGS